MSLTKCNTCGGQVAVSAAACPHCGVASPGLTQQEVSISKERAGFFEARWIAGLAFWPGVFWVAYPALIDAPKEVFLEHWAISKWLIGYGVIHYLISEVQRNLYERKIQKQAQEKES